MTDVFAWPPVAVQARYWTMEQPVSRPRSMITGRSYKSAAGRKRLLAGFDVAGWPRYSSGYLEALWRYLDGGTKLVRLSSCRIPYGKTVDNHQRGGRYIEWTMPPQEIMWLVPPAQINWFDGAILSFTITTQDGFPAVRVTGLPPNAIVAIPGEFVTVWVGNQTSASETHMIAAEAQTNASGVAVITLVTQPSGTGQISIGGHETGVFELVSDWPKVMNRLLFPENYGLEFREVFEDEWGPFNEVNPWGTPSFREDAD